MIARLSRFVAGSYPLPFSLVYAAVFALGATGLFAALDQRAHRWGLGAATLVAFVTVAGDLLLVRAADDIRDLDYDRRHHPTRPLASGAVQVGDLLALLGFGAVALPLFNAFDPAAAALVAAQLAYLGALLAVDRWLRWPSGESVLLSLAVNCPVQLLLLCYLYAGYLRSTGLPPDRHGLLAIVVVALVLLHFELARKITRNAAPGERSYVTVLGPSATAGAAIASALAAMVVVLLAVRPWPVGPRPDAGWAWAAALPIVFPAATAVLFWRVGVPRWPLRLSLLYVEGSLLAYFLIGLLGPGGEV
jgi:hypothetical protein